MNFFNESQTYESEVKKSFDKTNVGAGAGAAANMNPGMNSCPDGGMMMDMPCCGMMPIYECPQERVCHRYICHEVPQV